jgi:LacI family transcriptional regulator
VSNVLNGRIHKMRGETLERVRQVIAENNYVSNMSGRTLGKYGSRIIAVVIAWEWRDELNAMQDPFLGEMIGALEHEIRKAGYFLMLYISAQIHESLNMAASWNAEGLIAVSYNAEDCGRFIEGAGKIGIPLVFIDAYYEGKGAFFNVGLRDRDGGFMMTEYLASLGHRRIAFLGAWPEPFGVDNARFLGCAAALNARGISCSMADYIHVSRNPEKRRAVLKQFMRERLRGYSALFFFADYLAADAVNIFRDEGVSVPDDVSVAGFDDNIFALQSRPRLTTVAQSVPQKAYFAVKLINALIKNETIEEKTICLPASLSIRESAGCPR